MIKENCIYYDDHFGFCKNKYNCNYRSDSGLCLYSNHIKIIAAKIREVRRLREIESAVWPQPDIERDAVCCGD